jgi:hypothetical protein
MSHDHWHGGEGWGFPFKPANWSLRKFTDPRCWPRGGSCVAATPTPAGEASCGRQLIGPASIFKLSANGFEDATPTTTRRTGSCQSAKASPRAWCTKRSAVARQLRTEERNDRLWARERDDILDRLCETDADAGKHLSGRHRPPLRADAGRSRANCHVERETCQRRGSKPERELNRHFRGVQLGAATDAQGHSPLRRCESWAISATSVTLKREQTFGNHRLQASGSGIFD